MFEKGIFWKDNFYGKARRGVMFRTVDLNKFIKKVESSETGGEVVGIKFDDNNLELIVKIEEDD